ncbi:hypothetical protein LSAT2_021623 [Lamellibrachia satsuma]|nr:hypothetical protein LSAT2_021623 [Lamellibrachia satsuma]
MVLIVSLRVVCLGLLFVASVAVLGTSPQPFFHYRVTNDEFTRCDLSSPQRGDADAVYFVNVKTANYIIQAQLEELHALRGFAFFGLQAPGLYVA